MLPYAAQLRHGKLRGPEDAAELIWEPIAG